MGSCVALVVLQLLLTSLTLSTAVIVRIDADNGTNTSDCITGNHSCRTLQYAVTNSYNDDTTFLLLSDLTLLSTVNFTSRHNITITGAAEQPKQLICNCNHSNCGLVFKNCSNLSLQSITVKNCSLESHFHKDLLMKTGVIIENGSGITSLDNFTATKNKGYGTVILNTGGTVLIYNSTFGYNYLKLLEQNQARGGGGLYIALSFDYNSTDCFNSESYYEIIDSNFHNNSIRWSKSFFQDWTASYGGGLDIFVGENAVNNTIIIQTCEFMNNTAAFGGGLFIACENTCVGNLFEIENSTFQYNSNKFGGGGVAIGITSKDSQDLPHGNTVTFQNCSFIKNTAWYGAGTAIYASRQQNDLSENHVNFTNCSWVDNTGVISPAVDLAPGFKDQDDTRFIVMVNFNDCVFRSNRINDYNHESDKSRQFEGNAHKIREHYNVSIRFIQQYHHSGVFLVTKLNVYFSGTNKFQSNIGTALYLSSAQAIFSEYSTTLFINNSGLLGGAVALNAYSRINYYDNVAFNFEANQATKGGAIYVHSIDQRLAFASYTCFLSHCGNFKDSVRKPRNVSFNFVANNATLYNASRGMYLMSSVFACLRSCDFITKTFNSTPQQVFGDIGCLGNFTYDSLNQVTSEGSIAVQVTQSNSTYVNITPGVIFSLPIDIYDSFGNDVTNISIYTAQIDSTCPQSTKIDPAFTNSPVNFIKILGEPETKGTLILSLAGAHDTQVELNFTLSWCRPGYVLHEGGCVCSASLNDTYHYHGIRHCNSSTDSAVIDPGLWVGYTNTTAPTQQYLYTAPCPRAYCKKTNLQLNVSADSLSEYICNGYREGFLCGTCQNGTSVFFNEFYLNCHKNYNCHLGPLFYAVLELLPVSVVFGVIILADISLTSGIAYSTIFVAQMLYSISFTVNGAISEIRGFAFVDYLYGIVDLKFQYISFCLWAGATTLDIQVMKYVSMAYAMLLVICAVLLVNYCNCGKLSKCCLRRSRQRSIVHGLSAFIVICYSQCAQVTFRILALSTATNMGKNYTIRSVFYKGDYDYFGSNHLPYAIPAIFVLLFVVVPLPLVLFLDPFLLKLEGVLNQREALQSCQPWTRFRMKFKPFLDSFQGCFGDDTRYFAGLFFIYRTVIHLISIIVETKVRFYVYLELMLVVMLTIQAVMQPFEKKWHNIVCSCMLFVFLTINSLAISTYLLFLSKNDELEIIVIQWFQTVLAFMPLLIGLFVLGKWIFRITKYKFIQPSDFTQRRRGFNHYMSLSLDDRAVS